MSLEIIILAAGKGSRMKSALPKVLHTLAGKPLLSHVLEAAIALSPSKIHIVVGHQSERVKAINIDTQIPINWVLQTQQLGTGHAVSQAMPDIDTNSTVLIMAGDVPRIKASTLKPLCESNTGINLLTAIAGDASGLGRIIRDDNNLVTEIVEHKDATPKQLEIQEFSTGIMAMNATQLSTWLDKVENKNAQQEYYLPDTIALAVSDGEQINATIAKEVEQVLGINSRAELATLERQHQVALANTLMQNGVGLADPARIDIRGSLTTGQDCFIDVNAVFEQKVTLGNNVTIGPNVMIRNSHIGDDCIIEANSVIDSAQIAAQCQIGPFARVRPETVLQTGSKIGNFVEIKKSNIGEDSKINHLSYIGDATVGRNVNIGAGVITCNYDGANKHQTIIGDDVFVGSDSQLIAPVEIGEGANIGAGSSIRKNAPANTLSMTPAKQIEIKRWKRPLKQTKP